jgi:hypothetical protein
MNPASRSVTLRCADLHYSQHKKIMARKEANTSAKPSKEMATPSATTTLKHKGEKLNSRAITPVDIPFWEPDWNTNVTNQDDKESQQRTWLTVQRDVMKATNKGNTVEVLTKRVYSLYGSANKIVKVRKTLEDAVFCKEDPPCIRPDKIQARMSNFALCLVANAISDFNTIVNQSQSDIFDLYSNYDKEDEAEKLRDQQRLKEYEEKGESVFYSWLLTENNLEEQVSDFECLVHYRVAQKVFKEP